MQAPPIQYLLVALAAGAIVGLVNEYRKISGAKVLMGLRTSIFVSLLGYASALLYEVTSSGLVLVAAIAAVTVMATAAYAARAAVARAVGATTYVSMVLLFMSGAMVGLGLYEYGLVIAVLTAALSLYKTQLLGAISKIRREELIALVNLLLIAAVVLPMLPDRGIGPYGLFNPFEFWLLVVVVAAIFFAQYVVLRATKRGLFAFTMIGGIVSSTTVTMSLIELGNERRGLGKAIGLNIIESNLPMIFIQVAATLYFSGGAVALSRAMPAIAVAAIVTAVIGLAGRRHLSPAGIEPPSTPLPLLRMLEFAGLLFVVTAAAKLAAALAPSLLPLTVFASALANVLGVVYAVGLLYAKGEISAGMAGYLAGLAMLAGIAEKAFLALMLKDGEARRIAAALSAALSAAVALALLAWAP